MDAVYNEHVMLNDMSGVIPNYILLDLPHTKQQFPFPYMFRCLMEFIYKYSTAHKPVQSNEMELVMCRLTASSRGYKFLPIFITFWDAPNQPNNSSGLASIAYSSFLSILINCIRYKSAPYLTPSVIEDGPKTGSPRG